MVLGINGSPRIGGNSDLLLDKALEVAKEAGAQIEKIILNNLKFFPCQECEKVKDDGSCIIEDDWQLIFKKIAVADAIILATPIFFGSLSAQTKMMIDRFQCLWRAKYMLKSKSEFVSQMMRKKTGVFIAVEGSTREDFFANAKAIVKNFFATINTDYQAEIFCSGVGAKGQILKHPEFLKQAVEIARKLARRGGQS
jgi:multimeric flavodoxin WrbA